MRKVSHRGHAREWVLNPLWVKLDWDIHEEADELFLGWKGRFRLEFRDRSVELGPGDEARAEPRCSRRARTRAWPRTVPRTGA